MRWHDHSAHYMGTQDPPAVQRDPSQRRVIDRYQVKMVWNGEDVVAQGRIIWVPPPSPWPWVAVAVVLSQSWWCGRRAPATGPRAPLSRSACSWRPRPST
ncbi:MAG: hypothetical protein U0W40_12015 [Acidimicrobiia bacterium]